MIDNEKNNCNNCEVNDGKSLHTCPFSEEINNDTQTLCNCCSTCENECCMDI